MRVVLDNLDQLAKGMGTTLSLTLVSFAFAMAIGTVVATFRVSPVPPLRAAGTFYVQTVRNTPLLVLMLLFLFGLTKVGIRFGYYTTAVIVLSGYTGAFVAETVRSGVNAVASGQAEAARALGLTFPQVLGGIVLPQAFRTVVAPLGNLFIALVKNSSIASAINVLELSGVADDLANRTAKPVPVFLGTAVAYLVLTIPAGWLVGVIERRTAIHR
jgi:glutamate transport system permease protein